MAKCKLLFNSYEFIFLYLPVVFIGMYLLGRSNRRLAALWLGLASLTFYGAWDARFVFLLLASIVFNYGMGNWIYIKREGCAGKQAKYILGVAITVNIILLGYFKYANFFIISISELIRVPIPAGLDVILPLGISFFTFTQIAFLVDVYRGIASEYNFIHYLLFVTYFPHLIAGPVLHHKQIMPQFSNPSTYRINIENVTAGLTIFVLGLAKKVLIADTLADYATPVFNAVRDGQVLMLFEAWIGVLAYTLQLYFDFSGYSDMAIGLSLMLNVRLPMNFDSPYKATSIIDFWRRWHMTLAAFLRDYVYYPLGGNRKGSTRRYANLMATMLLGGLWHGAGWTFILWGGLHGLFLVINHGWRKLKKHLAWREGGPFSKLCAGSLTFLAVIFGWVFFRADSIASARSILSSMAGLNGVSLPGWLEGTFSGMIKRVTDIDIVFAGLTPITEIAPYKALTCVTLGLALVWFFPNVRQMLAKFKPVWEDVAGVRSPAIMAQGRMTNFLDWRLTANYAVAIGFIFFITVLKISNKASEFLYFQF